MNNYDITLKNSEKLFLRWDQEKMIERCGLEYDADYLYISFLGQRFRIDRGNGHCENADEGMRPATFEEALTIYDFLCRDIPVPEMCGRWYRVNSLKHVGQTQPGNDEAADPWAARLQRDIVFLAPALERIAVRPYPKGDAACEFPLIGSMNAVFQFWEADEDFPASTVFYWDEHILSCLRYETVHYAMGAFRKRLNKTIEELKENLN